MRKKTKKSFDKLTFGKRLKALREQTGLNQEEIGAAINRTRVSYLLIEAGKSAPSADCIMDLLKAFESHKVYTTLDYLFGRTNHSNDTYQIKELREKLEKAEKELVNCQKISKLQEQLLENQPRK